MCVPIAANEVTVNSVLGVQVPALRCRLSQQPGGTQVRAEALNNCLDKAESNEQSRRF